MADAKISQLPDGGTIQPADQVPVNRAGTTMRATVAGGGGGGGRSFARVQRSSAIAGWDGSTLPFNVVSVDADGLWDATNHQYVAQAAGWYEVSAYATGLSPHGVSSTATADIAVLNLTVVVFGAGDNVSTAAGDHTQVTSGFWVLPPLHGHTHLDVGDAVAIQGSNGLDVPAGFTFAIQLVKAG